MRPPVLVFLKTPVSDETQMQFWRRKALERAQESRKLAAELSHTMALLEAAYDLIARHHTSAEPCREDAVAEVVERFEETLEQETVAP